MKKSEDENSMNLEPTRFPIIDHSWVPESREWEISDEVVSPFEDPNLMEQYEKVAEEFARLEHPEEITERIEPVELRYVGRQLELPEALGQVRGVRIWSARSPYLESPITLREMTSGELSKFYGRHRLGGVALPREEEALIAKGVIGASHVIPLHELGHFRKSGLPHEERRGITLEAEGLASDVTRFYEEFAAWYWALRRAKSKPVIDDIKKRIRGVRSDSIIFLGKELTSKIENLARRKKIPRPFEEESPKEQLLFSGL